MSQTMIRIQEQQLLAQFTTFAIGGPARFYVEITCEADLLEALNWAEERALPLFVLGGGSNLLVADSGFDGLVLHMRMGGVLAEGNVLSAGAGVEWDQLVSMAVERNLAGVECLAGIPGTVGGTPVQNVGAYGQEVSATISLVRAYDLQTKIFVEFAGSECAFRYRESRFNRADRGRYIVTRVAYRLQAGGKPYIAYADLARHFAGRIADWSGQAEPTLGEVAAAVRLIRHSKGMLMVEEDADCKSAGSFFKNPSVSPEVAARVEAFAAGKGIALRTYPAADGRIKLPAAWLIEQAGFQRGLVRGRAGINSRHTLALINRGGATAAEVMALADEIQAGVQAVFGVRLAMEPVRVGF